DADLESLIPRVGALSEWPTSMIGLCQEKTRFSRRALRRSAQILSLQNSQPRSVPSRRGLLPFAEPDIHLLSPAIHDRSLSRENEVLPTRATEERANTITAE